MSTKKKQTKFIFKENYHEFMQYKTYYTAMPFLFLFFYVLLPLVAGYVVSSISGTTQNITYSPDLAKEQLFSITQELTKLEIGIRSNFQFEFHQDKFLIVFIFISIFSIILTLYGNNVNNSVKIILRIFKVYFVFLFFYIGMSNVEKEIFAQLKEIKELVLLTLTYMSFIKLISRSYEDSGESKFEEKLKVAENEDSKKEYRGLIKSRIAKANLLEKALDINNTILINGKWGIGKTKFLEIFFMEQDYHTIWIDVMLFNTRDKIKDEFMNQLRGVFKKERIIFNHIGDFNYFLNFVGNNFSNLIKGYFNSSNSFNSAKESLKEDFKYLDKKIVVIFDNLERIVENGVALDKEWKEVISFIHDISEFENLKNIVVADYDKLTRNIYSGEIKKTIKRGKEKDIEETEVIMESQQEGFNIHKEYFDKFYDVMIELKEAFDADEIMEAKLEADSKTKKDELGIDDLKNTINNLSQIFKSFEEAVEGEGEKNKYLLEETKFIEFKKLVEQYFRDINNPRTIEKIRKKYAENLILKESGYFKDVEKEVETNSYLIIASIFEILNFDLLNEIDKISKISQKNYYYIMFLKYFDFSIHYQFSFYKTAKKLSLKLNEKEESIFNRLFFYNQNEVVYAKDRIEKIKEEKKSIKAYKVDKYINYLEIYLESNIDNEKLKEAYKILREKILSDKSKFLQRIRAEVIWKIEDLCHEDEIGELCKYIYKNNLSDKDVYTYKQNIIQLFAKEINLLLNIYYTDLGDTLVYNSIVENYYSFENEMIKILEIEDLNSLPLISRKLSELLSENGIGNNKILIKRLNILFERLSIVASMKNTLDDVKIKKFKTYFKWPKEELEKRLIEISEVPLGTKDVFLEKSVEYRKIMIHLKLREIIDIILQGNFNMSKIEKYKKEISSKPIMGFLEREEENIKEYLLQEYGTIGEEKQEEIRKVLLEIYTENKD